VKGSGTGQSRIIAYFENSFEFKTRLSPSPYPDTDGRAKFSSTNIQPPEKHQAKSSNDARGGFGAWSLDILWSLVLGAWIFSDGIRG